MTNTVLCPQFAAASSGLTLSTDAQHYSHIRSIRLDRYCYPTKNVKLITVFGNIHDYEGLVKYEQNNLQLQTVVYFVYNY